VFFARDENVGCAACDQFFDDERAEKPAAAGDDNALVCEEG